MFEDSLMESQNRLSSPSQRWTTALSLTLQCTIAAAIIALPLLHPEALPFRVDAPKIVLPMRQGPSPVPRAAAANPGASATVASDAARAFTAPARIPPLGQTISDAPPTGVLIGTGMGDPNGIASVLTDAAPGTGPRVGLAPTRPALTGHLQISTGVSAGHLLAPIVPVYPRIAVAAHVEGVVRVEAILSKSGQIESARAVSGPEMLRQAALDAIRNARYRPFLLNGSPTEVETTITVNFKLAG